MSEKKNNNNNNNNNKKKKKENKQAKPNLSSFYPQKKSCSVYLLFTSILFSNFVTQMLLVFILVRIKNMGTIAKW